MLTTTINRLKLGGQAAAIATLMATAAFAQTAPADDLTTMDAVQFPVIASVQTDQDVVDSLTAQGYDNIVVLRGAETVTVTAERGGLPTEMMFSTADGTLLLVDGVEPAPQPGVISDAASTDGREPASETADSANFSGQDDVVLDAPTAAIEGDDTDPVAETIPLSATDTETSGGDDGLSEDGGAETDGTTDN